MKYSKIKTQQKFRENPFLSNIEKDMLITKKTSIVQSKDKNQIQMIVSQSGEVEGYSAFVKFIEVDEEKFAKIYLSQFECFWDLSKPAIRVFGYIINILKPNQDFVLIKLEDCLNYTKYKGKNAIITGLSDLIEKNIIAKSVINGVYYINPLIVFNGSRVSFVKTYIKKKSKSLNKE